MTRDDIMGYNKKKKKKKKNNNNNSSSGNNNSFSLSFSNFWFSVVFFLRSFSFIIPLCPLTNQFFIPLRPYCLILSLPIIYCAFFLSLTVSSFLADRTATQYDRLLAAACCPSVCLSVTLCILTLRAGVQG